MPDSSALFIFLLATLALNFTPGPDMLYVIGRSAGQGRAAGVVSALGIGVGTLVHMSAVALGLSTLLISLPLAYDFIRYAGAAYLAYLGIRTLTNKSGLTSEDRVRDDSLARIFRQGVITNVLNPKVALFFLAFLPQFVDPARGPVVLQVILLGLIFDTSGTLVNTGVAMVGGYIGNLLKNRPRFARAQRLFTGTVFLGLAARIALLERK